MRGCGMLLLLLWGAGSVTAWSVAPTCNGKRTTTTTTGSLLLPRPHHPTSTTTTHLGGAADWYGRGSLVDIWPPTNGDRPVRLPDSFPQGVVPANAIQEAQAQRKGGGGQRRLPTPDELVVAQRRGLRWISFLLLTVALALPGALGPLDMGGLLLWNFYSYLLIQLAKQHASSSVKHSLASRPADGHAPAALLRNPLRASVRGGRSSIHWDAWINFVIPALLWMYTLVVDPLSLTTGVWGRVALGRPLFWWMTIQVADDILSADESRIPLPIQYWIRLSSRVIRWVFLTLAVVLTYWPTTSSSATTSLLLDAGGGGGSHLAVWGAIPLVHWLWSSVAIFGYWIPRASLQYMRAHWVATEAATLTLQATAVHHYSVPGLTSDTSSPEGKPS